MVGKHSPEPCTRWAVAAEGFCEQHYLSKVEDEKRKAREAAHTLQLNERIDAYIEMRKEHPSVWDTGMAAGAGLEPTTSRLTADRSTTELPRKGRPHRLTELA